jgi:hypothetical protein
MKKLFSHAVVFCVLLLSLSTVQAGQMFKCKGAAGQTEFSDKPCVGGQELSVKPNTLDNSGEREQSLKSENRKLRQQFEATERAKAAPGVVADKSASHECKQATQHYKASSSSIGSGKTAKGDLMAMRAACGMPEPDQVNINIRQTKPSQDDTVFCTATGRGKGVCK